MTMTLVEGVAWRVGLAWLVGRVVFGSASEVGCAFSFLVFFKRNIVFSGPSHDLHTSFLHSRKRDLASVPVDPWS